MLGLDVGDKTIGVAASNELSWVEPLLVVRRTRQERDLEALLRLCEEREIERIVVGLPLNMDGSEGPRAAKTRRFAAAAAAALGREVVLWDERLSTFEADRALREAALDGRRRRELVDMVAAQVILRSYLDAGAPEGGHDGAPIVPPR